MYLIPKKLPINAIFADEQLKIDYLFSIFY